MQLKLTGVKECMATLKNVPDAVKRKYLRIAMNAAGGILKQGALSRVPSRTKLLKQSLGVKVTQKRNGEWYVVVGAKRGMKRGLKTTKTRSVRALSKRATSNLKFTPGGNRSRFADPARYSHLVEKGTRSHYVSVRNARVLVGAGATTYLPGRKVSSVEFFGKRVVVRAKPSRFLAATAQSNGPAAVNKAVLKLREAVLSHANK